MLDFFRWIRFNLWYFRKPPWDTGITPPELEAALQALPPGRALDLGCGTGTNLLRLLRAGWQVCGVDFAIKAVNRAKARVRRAGFEADIRLGDVTRTEFTPRSFDLIYDIGCFHSLDLPKRRIYSVRVANWLANGGTFLLYSHLKHRQDAEMAGISEEDVLVLSEQLHLKKREDSLDRFGRSAVWLTFSQGDGE